MSKKDGLPAEWVFQLFETGDRRLWVATARGIAEFLRAGNDRARFRSYDERNGLSYFDITALNEDAAGNLWLGTNTAGAMKFTRGGFSTFGQQDGIETVNAVFEDRPGNLCFRGTVLGDATTSVFEGAEPDPLGARRRSLHGRLGWFDGQRFDWFKPAAVGHFGWVPEQVTLQARTGEWWVGTGEGLYRFPAADNLAHLKTARPTAVYTVRDGLAAPQVYRLFEDSRGNVWVSTLSATAIGLARWESDTGRLYNLASSPGLAALKEGAARSFGEDSEGSVWIGFDGQVARYRNGSFTLFAADAGLPDGAIMAIHRDHAGRLWLASARGGLVRVDHPAADRPNFFRYTTKDGLSSNNTEVITEDAAGHIYVGGGQGLDRLDAATGRVKHFTAADGLAPGLFRAAFRDRHGVLWFGMTSGLARLAPQAERTRATPPVLVSGLRIRGVPEFISALGERQLSLNDLAPHQNQIQIDFVGLSFASGEVLRYQYRLEGAGADWSALSEQRSVTFASLPAGRYTFFVRAVNSDGMVSPEPATVGFAIRSPFWRQAWFVTLLALALGLMTYAVYRYRVARLLEIAHLRMRIATDLHDDIGANLTRIALLSEVARRGSEDEGPHSSIARIARESVSSMSDIVWAINPRRESLLDLTRRMRQHADELFTQRDIELHFNAPSSADSLKLGVDVRRDVLLIFKEAVSNAARHSGCSSATIDVRVEGSRLVLMVADNGVGFDTSRESEGQGLMSMARRAQRLGGTMEIQSGSSGTTVTLTVSL
jgi:signal transduction histidine kinase